MLPQSAVFTTSTSATTSTSTGDVLVLSSGLKRVLVPVPASYAELVDLTKETFDLDTDALVFETDDLNICRGSSVEIHKSSWEAVRSVVGTVSVVVVKGDAATSSRRIRVSTSIQQGLNEQDVKPTSSRLSVSSRVLTEKQITLKEEQENVLPSSLDGDVETQVEDELFGETTEEEEEDEEELFRSPAKKGKGRARKQIISDDEDELDEPATSTLSAKHSNKGFISPRPSAVSARPTPRDIDDMFSPARPVRSKKALAMSNDSSEENDENLAPPRIKLSTTRRVTPVTFETEEELENDENAAPSPLRQSIARSEARISTSNNPEVRSVKKTPAKANNYAAQDEVSPSPKPKFRPARSPQPSSSTHAPVHRSALRQSTLDFDRNDASERKVEPIAPLRETAPLPEEKILVTIAHPESQQESKFKIKGKHTVEKVLKPACQAFGLDMNFARLMLEEEVDGIEMTSECDRHQTMISAGVRNNSYLVIVMDEVSESE